MPSHPHPFVARPDSSPLHSPNHHLSILSMMQLKSSRSRPLWLSLVVLFCIWTGWLFKHQFYPKTRLLPFQRTSPLSLSTSGFDVGNQTVSDRPLILYAYFDTENARRNLDYFLLHALHDGADFVFVLNGEDDIESVIPNEPNIRYVRRKNECYDLGAFAEVLIKDDLYKKYNKFITMNASIRGPFLPYWATGCWTDMFLDRVTNTTKVSSHAARLIRLCSAIFHCVTTNMFSARGHDGQLRRPSSSHPVYDLGH
jgi:hypothetical protein